MKKYILILLTALTLASCSNTDMNQVDNPDKITILKDIKLLNSNADANTYKMVTKSDGEFDLYSADKHVLKYKHCYSTYKNNLTSIPSMFWTLIILIFFAMGMLAGIYIAEATN